MKQNRSGSSSIGMLMKLAQNDIRARYSASVFGIVWAFAVPLSTIFIFWVVFEMGFKNLPVGDAPYILWFVTAYVPWIFFTDVLTSGCNCLVEYSYLVRKIRFPVKMIPQVKLVSAWFLHLFFLAFLCVIRLICGLPLEVAVIQILYYSFAASVLGLGLTYLLSALTIFFKDISSIVNIVVQVGFWVTPVMWNEDIMLEERISRVLALNPMHYIVCGYRDCFLEGRWFWENPGETIYFWCVAAVIMVVGVRVFHKLSPLFADEV